MRTRGQVWQLKILESRRDGEDKRVHSATQERTVGRVQEVSVENVGMAAKE